MEAKKLKERAIADALKISAVKRLIPDDYSLKAGLLFIVIQNSKCNTKSNYEEWIVPQLRSLADSIEQSKGGESK